MARPRLPAPLAALLIVGALVVWGGLSGRGAPEVQADAQTAVGALGDGGGVLRWRPDLGGPRRLLPSAREAITDAYLRGERELRYAARSGRPTGLSDLFQSAALDDARASAAAGDALLSWGHAPQLRFYSPDGSVVAFTDQFQYVALNPHPGAGEEVLRLASRTLDVIMQLDDGNWRTHHLRVVADRELPGAGLHPPPGGFRAVRAGPGWAARSADTLRRDVSAVRELGLDTLLVPVATRGGPQAQEALAEPLTLLLREAAAQRVAVMLDVRAAGLQPLELPALDAALRALSAGAEPLGTGPPARGRSGTGQSGAALAGVLLDAGGVPSAERLRLWRRVIRSRLPEVPVGLRADRAPGPLEFRVGQGAARTYRPRWWPGWPFVPARQAWQAQQFVAAHHAAGFEIGSLYDEPGTAGLLTPDGRFRPAARGVQGAAGAPTLAERLLELGPLLLLAALEGVRWWRQERRRGPSPEPGGDS